jgi:cobalt-zinc-cadmium efflux system outer membrane protein
MKPLPFWNLNIAVLLALSPLGLSFCAPLAAFAQTDVLGVKKLLDEPSVEKSLDAASTAGPGDKSLAPIKVPDLKTEALASPNQVSGSVEFSNLEGRGAPGASILQCLDEALIKSPRASAIRSQLQISRAAYADAATQPNAGLFFDRGPYAEQVRRIGPAFNWEPPWKLVFRMLAAKRLVEQAKTDLLAQLWALRADVRRAYTELVVAQETVETLNTLFDLAQRLLVVSEKRFQAGDVPELDVLKARLATSQADVERQVGARRVIRAKQQLNIIMGRVPEKAINVPRLPAFIGKLDSVLDDSQKSQLLPDFSQQVPTLQSYLAKGLEQRLELKSLAQKIKLNEANLRTAYGNMLPNPSVGFGSSVSGNAPTGPKLSSIYVSLLLETPITNWNQGEIIRLKAVAKQLKYEVDGQRNIVTQQISSAYNNLLAARQKLKQYQEHILQDSMEVARLARRSYEVGQSDITATLQVQQANVTIRGQYLDAVRLYQEAFTELEQACGRPLEY